MEHPWTIGETRFVLNFVLASQGDIGFKIVGVTMTYGLLSKVRAAVWQVLCLGFWL